jgi:hypothetical protein
MSSRISTLFSLTPQEQESVEREAGKLKSLAEFFNESVEALKENSSWRTSRVPISPVRMSTELTQFVEGHVIDPFRDRRRDAVQHQGLHPPPLRAFVNYG